MNKFSGHGDVTSKAFLKVKQDQGTLILIKGRGRAYNEPQGVFVHKGKAKMKASSSKSKDEE